MDSILNEFKQNIFIWYDFKQDASVLAFGENMEEYENILKSKVKNIVFETDKNNIGGQFDYILVKDDIEQIQNIKHFLKSDGTIILLMKNRFGIRYFAGDRYKSCQAFSTLYNENSGLLSKYDIEKILKKYGFSDYKFYYPVPDYNVATTIFSDNYLPESGNTKITYNNAYEENVKVVFDEARVIKKFVECGIFDFFANAFLIEINPKCNVKFVSYNNIRRKEYRLVTKIYDTEVVKEPISSEAENHIKNMKKYIEDLKNHNIKNLDKGQENQIISKYMSTPSLYEYILEKIKKNDIEGSIKIIKKWYDYLHEKFAGDKQENLNENIECDQDTLKKLTIVKNAYIDLVFENAFIIDEEFVFFDQEWCFENLPIEFILYRAINNMYSYNWEIEENLPKEELFKKFEIFEFLELFKNMEIYVQSTIADFEVDEKYNKIHKIINFTETLEKLSNLEKAYSDLTIKLQDVKDENEYNEKKLKEKIQHKEMHEKELETALAERQETINKLNEIIKVKDNQINDLENMKIVKISKKLRNLKDGNK